MYDLHNSFKADSFLINFCILQSLSNDFYLLIEVFFLFISSLISLTLFSSIELKINIII